MLDQPPGGCIYILSSCIALLAFFGANVTIAPMKRFALILAILSLFIVSCTTTENNALPTRAELAEGIALSGGNPAGLPPTWTPEPNATIDDAGNFNNAVTLQPTTQATATILFPTRTPLPPTSTHTPTPEPTRRYVPYIPNLPPTDELGPSKLGLHVIRNNDPNIMEFIRQAQPAVIKVVDDLGFLEEVKQVSPWTITVGRVNTFEGPPYGGNPYEAARDFVNAQLDKYRANPGVDYWEGYNEPDPNLDNMLWYAEFEAERTRIMAEYGFRTAVGGFATGVPEFEEFELFVEAIRVAQEFRGILTLHEYGAPDMTYLYGGALPGKESYPNRGALTFRYRWFYEDILEPQGLVIPLVISEAGVDGIIGNRPGPSGLGWQDFQGYWVQQGWGPDGPSAFINQLAWYDVGTRQDGYVIGYTVFTAGGIGQWNSYDINPILPQLTGYVVSQQR